MESGWRFRFTMMAATLKTSPRCGSILLLPLTWGDAPLRCRSGSLAPGYSTGAALRL
jgi:hypothetical protein